MSRVNGIPVTGVNELVLEVLDLEAAERVYSGVLGLPVVERQVTDPDGNVVELWTWDVAGQLE